MKYMTFNSSCSYAGLANMLGQYGVDTDDRTIALGMELPYMFSYEDGVYMAGPSLQSSRWFNLYLNPLGFEMVEKEIEAGQVADYLRTQKTAMLGLQADNGGKHAVVYLGVQGEQLIFLNNKWEHTDVPEQISLTNAQLLDKIGATAMVATLQKIPPKAVNLKKEREWSVQVLWQNFEEIQNLSRELVTVNDLRARLNTLFRPLLLDGITMLSLLGEEGLAAKFRTVQTAFLTLLRLDGTQAVRLAEHLPFDDFSAAVDGYAQLILQKV